jgi:hypothetical protein
MFFSFVLLLIPFWILNFIFCLILKRPDWEKCSSFIEGGLDKWKETISMKTSSQILENLLSELSGKKKETDDYFNGLVLNYSKSYTNLIKKVIRFYFHLKGH